jgi:hypothetical protein
VEFIREHADRRQPEGDGGLRWGVEPICAVLTEHGLKIAPSTYYEHQARTATARARRDVYLLEQTRRVYREDFAVCGARKIWLARNREGIAVARCTVEWLMRGAGLAGARRERSRRLRSPAPTVSGPRTWSPASSPPPPQIGFGWRTSPTCRPGQGGCTPNKPGTEIMRFSIGNDDLAGMAQVHVGQMGDDAAQAFVDRYSSLYGEGLGHSLDYISRPTARGTEHYFSPGVYSLFRWH